MLTESCCPNSFLFLNIIHGYPNSNIKKQNAHDYPDNIYYHSLHLYFNT